ncbi:MAG TPA: MlaD family protein [Candidatus Binatia bacterium]|nr:MlaD family protein [Candidatus Binatia bacterium]
MNKKVSPAVIGAFVLGALALIVIATLIFGSGRLFRQTREFVLYFDGSVNGLRIGAPVKIKGVEIGAVKDIRLQLEKSKELKIPVIIELDLKKFTARGATQAAETAMEPEALHKVIVDRGLRGQLEMESLVTGLLFVALDFFPGSPIHLVQQANGDYEYPEIPTLPTTLEQARDTVTQILNKLEEIDFKGLIASLDETVNGIKRTVNSPELESTIRSLQKTMPKIDEAVVSIRDLAVTLNDNAKRLSTSLEQTSIDARTSLKQADEALKQATQTMKSAETAVANIETLSDPDSPVIYELGRSLREVSAAARSLRLLANYLERNPRALIFGKPESKEN